MPRRQNLDLAEYLPYLVNRVGTALASRFLEDALMPAGLSIAMWRVLVVLSDGGRQRQIDLADLASIEVSTLSRLVTRLVRMGLVTRTRSETNSREVGIQLTPKGDATLRRLVPVAIAAEETAVAGVSAKDVAVMKKCLRQIYGNLGR
jgi:DNA-binding MarR family transcriptional regulator